MFSRRLLVAAAAATFVLGLIVLFPARLAVSWFAPADLRISGVEGTVWRGRAAAASAGGIYLAPLSWRFRPLALLGGRVGYHIDTGLPGGEVTGDVAVTVTGAVRLADLEASLRLSDIGRMLPVAQAQGRLRANLERATFRDGWPTELVGTVSIEDLVYIPAGSNPIGSYRVEFLPRDDGDLRGVLSDGGGPLEVAGEIRLADERTYELRGQVRARPGAPNSLTNSLRFLGSPDQAGMREFSLAGRL
ncbi:MAG: type II secretion system protein N [Gammaproteobacteria bacterium]